MDKVTMLGREVSKALLDVMIERERQITVEGWTVEHDDAHDQRELNQAGACYAVAAAEGMGCGSLAPEAWPWDATWWKPRDRRSNLVRATALLIAEIERIDREKAAAS